MDIQMPLSCFERQLIARAGEKRRPIYGNIELSPLCNMDCDMCYVRLCPQEMARQGRLRGAQEWLALGKQMRESGVLYLQLTGGEPLLYPQFREVYLGLRRMGMVITVNTNGTLLDEAWAEFFAKNPPRRVNVSLYGPDDAAYARLCHAPGGFERAVRGIRLLRGQGVDVKINAALTRENAGRIGEYAALSRELDAPLKLDTYVFPATRERERAFCQSARVSPAQAAAEEVELIAGRMGVDDFLVYAAQTAAHIANSRDRAAQPERPGCLAGSCAFAVSWQGFLCPCVLMNGPQSAPFEIGFEAAWQELCRAVDTIRLPAPCAGCRLKSVCGVCAAAAQAEEKDARGRPTYLCQCAKETAQLLAEIARRLQSGVK